VVSTKKHGPGELYADLVWLLEALEKDRDVTSGPDVVRAAMKYIAQTGQIDERQRILDEELSKVEISTEPGANPVGKLIEVSEPVEERMERHSDPCGYLDVIPCICASAEEVYVEKRMSEQVIGDYVVRSSLTMPPAATIRNVPLERVVDLQKPEVLSVLLERDVPVSQLLTGDRVFSESAGTWHDVRIDGQALYLKRGESWVAMSHLPRDTVFRTRRSASGQAAGELFDNFGGEVIRDGLGR